MQLPSWIKDALKDLLPDVLVEFFGVHIMKKFLKKKDGIKTETQPAEKEKAEEAKIPQSGMFTLEDETRFFEMMAQLSQKNATKISAFLGTLEPWERRKFRVAVGNSGELTIPSRSDWVSLKKSEIMKDFPLRKGEATAGKETRVEYDKQETKTGGSTESLGIKFLKSFAKCTETEMRAVCKASGVLDSPIEPVKKAIAEIGALLQANEPVVCDSIKAVTDKLKEKNGGSYTGFWSTTFPKKKRSLSSTPPMPDLTKEKYFWPVVLTALTLGFVLFWPLSLVVVGISLLIYGFIVLGKHSWPISFAALVIGLLIYGSIFS